MKKSRKDRIIQSLMNLTGKWMLNVSVVITFFRTFNS